MLCIDNLKVEVAGRCVIHGLGLEIKPGEVHCLFGPNGSGKTSLLMAIMGISGYRVIEGKILFKGVDISGLPINERVKLGLGISFQRPPSIPGVKLHQIASLCLQNKKTIEEIAKELNLTDFLERDLNVGFSGGEIKRSELFQLYAQSPDLAMLDEPESGVDIENIALIGKVINGILQRGRDGGPNRARAEIKAERYKSGLIITHTGFILNYVDVDKGHVLARGRLCCSGNPYKIFRFIKEKGYDECIKCAYKLRR